MEYDIERVNRLLKNVTPRKITMLTKLAGLNDDEIRIINLKWIEGKSDIQICDAIGYSTATLTRKRKACYIKLIDALDLYGLSDLDSLPVLDILGSDGQFYKAQEALVRYFVRNRDDAPRKTVIVNFLNAISEVI